MTKYTILQKEYQEEIQETYFNKDMFLYNKINKGADLTPITKEEIQGFTSVFNTIEDLYTQFVSTLIGNVIFLHVDLTPELTLTITKTDKNHFIINSWDGVDENENDKIFNNIHFHSLKENDNNFAETMDLAWGQYNDEL